MQKILLLLLSIPLMLFGTTFTQEQVVSYAATHSPSLTMVKKELTIQELEKKKIFSHFLPRLDLKSQMGVFYNPASISARPIKWGDSLSIALSQKFYDNGKTFLSYEKQDFVLERNYYELKKEQNKVCLDVLLAYYDYLSAIKESSVQTKKHEILSKQYDLTSKAFHQGLKQEQDFLRAKADLSLVDLTISEVKNKVEMALITLKKEMSYEEEATLEVGSSGPDQREDLDEKLDPINISQHVDSQIDRFHELEQQIKTRFSEKELWPQISILGDFTVSHQDFMTHIKKWNIGEKNYEGRLYLAFEWNLWDGKEQRNGLKMAVEEESKRKLESQKNHIDLLKEIALLQKNIEANRSHLKLSQNILDLEQKSFSMVEEEFRSGRSSYVEFSTALQTLLLAEQSYYHFLYSLKKDLARYRYHQGTLYASYL